MFEIRFWVCLQVSRIYMHICKYETEKNGQYSLVVHFGLTFILVQIQSNRILIHSINSDRIL